MIITIDTAKNEDYIAINHLGETVTERGKEWGGGYIYRINCVSSIPMKLNFMRFRDEECKKKNEDEYRNQAIKSLMNENERLFCFTV